MSSLVSPLAIPEEDDAGAARSENRVESVEVSEVRVDGGVPEGIRNQFRRQPNDVRGAFGCPGC